MILRPVHILGGVRNAPSNYLRLKAIPMLLGFDPMIQVIHQDDVVSAVLHAMRPGLRGIYNLAGPIHVDGSAAGDTLQVEILSLTPGPWGWTGVIPGLGLLPDDFPDPLLKIWDLLRNLTRWLLNHRGGALDIASIVERYAPGVAELRSALPRSL